MTYTLDEILEAYKDCGISYAAAMNMITSDPPNGLGYPLQTATDYLNNTERNCGNIPPPPPPPPPNDQDNNMNGVLTQQYPAIPDNFYGFLLLLGGLR